MITHYGLFWKERDVFWGSPGPTGGGELRGKEKEPRDRRGAPTKQEASKYKDFRNFVGLYCLYGNGELLYVGEAGLDTERTLFARLKEHRKGPMAGRWDRFSWFGREVCAADAVTNLKAAMGQLEAAAIAIINPGFNKQSGTFAGATQVFQLPHENADGDVETKLERILARLDQAQAAPQAIAQQESKPKKGRRKKSEPTGN
jgi:hypothetical protein